MSAEALDAVSPFVIRHRGALMRPFANSGAAGAPALALDLACGRGRHARRLADWGLRVVALDRHAAALRGLVGVARIALVRADVEDSRGLALRPGCFDVVLITRFLNRERCSTYAGLLRPGGVLLYETFLDRQRELGRGPTRSAFLLTSNELPTLFPSFEVLDYREELREAPQREWVASLLARKASERRA